MYSNYDHVTTGKKIIQSLALSDQLSFKSVKITNLTVDYVKN